MNTETQEKTHEITNTNPPTQIQILNKSSTLIDKYNCKNYYFDIIDCIKQHSENFSRCEV